MTQGKGIGSKAERKGILATNKPSAARKNFCIYTFKDIDQTCCGKAKLAGSSRPGMISKGKPAAI